MGLILFFIGILGLFVGSFLLVLIDRIPRNESFFINRSHCDFCKKTIAWYDLLPVLSWLMLRGRCRHCKNPIGYQYPLIELLTSSLFLITFLTIAKQPFSSQMLVLQILFALFIVACLLVTFFIDLRHEIIPFIIILPATGVTFLFLMLVTPQEMVNHLLSGLLAALFFFVIFLATKQKGMGFGDVVYAFFMGLLLGFPSILFGLYIAFLTGAVVSLILIVLKKKKLRGDTIPFGPFLVIGTYVLFLWETNVFAMVFSYLPF